jgi:predicted O-methyltransferase YrrM
MNLFSTELETYLTEHSQQESLLLRQLREETDLKHRRPHMLSGPYQGSVLSMISKLLKPKKILEIGTYTGYSALCLAEGMSKDGSLTTIDKDKSVAEIAARYFEQSAYKSQISQITGNALEVIQNLNETFDLVFIDADKKNYANYFHLLLEKMKPGGVILSDNVLWKGKVFEKENVKDDFTNAIKDYNKLLANHPKIETIMLPIRDGMSISRIKD